MPPAMMVGQIMVKGETRAAVKGLRRATETRNARAETLGSDGGQQTRKPVPGGAVGLAGTEKSTQDLFRVPMVRAEGEAGTGRGGDRDRGAAGWGIMVSAPDGFGGNTMGLATGTSAGLRAGHDVCRAPGSAARWGRAGRKLADARGRCDLLRGR